MFIPRVRADRTIAIDVAGPINARIARHLRELWPRFDALQEEATSARAEVLLWKHFRRV